MKNVHEELGIAMLGLFLSLGLSLNVYAQTEVVKAAEESKVSEVTQSAPAAVPQPATKPSTVPLQSAPSPDQNRELHSANPGQMGEQAPGDQGDNGGMNGQPPLSRSEIQNFNRQFGKDVPRDVKQVLKDLGAMKGDEVSMWKATLSTILADAKLCVSDFAKASQEEKRDVMNDCFGKNFQQDIQEIREQFIPERELKNEYSQMKNQERELNRFLTKLIGAPTSEKRKRALVATTPQSPIVTQLNEMLTSLATNRALIQKSSGADQRSAVEEYRNNNQGTWDEINKLRAVIEIPDQLKDVKTQLKFVTTQVNPSVLKNGSTGPIPFEKTASFFGIDLAALQSAVKEKADTIAEIETAVETGDAETAQSLMQESIYNGWHPGDMRGLLDMTKGAYQQTKAIRDNELREQIITIIEPIVETMGSGDYRAAREGIEQVSREMHSYERFFNGPQRGRSTVKMDAAFDKLEGLMKKKFEKYMQNDGQQEGGDEEVEE